MYLKTISTLTAIMLSCTLAHADCDTRPTTQAERDFELNTLSAVKKAMPAAPVGWKMREESRINATTSTCRGHNSPVDFNYKISYHRSELTPAMKELKAKNEKRADERRKLKKEYEKSPEYLKNHERLSETYKLVTNAANRVSEAVKNKNATAQNKAQAEIKALQDEQQALYAKDKVFYEKIVAEESADRAAEDKNTHAEITVSINDYYPDGMKNAKAFTPTNAQAAFTWDYPPYQGSLVTMTSVNLFYGDWASKNNSEGTLVFSPVFAKNTKAGTAPHIYITVTANDNDRAAELAKKIDQGAIKALISK